jgi:hypothetical protein
MTKSLESSVWSCGFLQRPGLRAAAPPTDRIHILRICANATRIYEMAASSSCTTLGSPLTSSDGDDLESDFASFLAWQDWDFPDRLIRDWFGIAALRGTDGGFLPGLMADHTAHAGKVRFVGGGRNVNDIVGDEVDLYGSVLREQSEQTGLSTRGVAPDGGW